MLQIMKRSKNYLNVLNELLSETFFTMSEIMAIKNYSAEHQVYILMLSPYIPFYVRYKAVQLYKKYFNPACTLPYSLVTYFVSIYNLPYDIYNKTLRDIKKAQLIIY